MHFRTTVLLAVFLLTTALLCSGQVTTATLYGIVRDTSGAVVPGAEVTLTHEGTAAVRHAVTGETGEFVFTALPVGSYMLKIAVQGFKTYESKGIELAAGQNVRQTYALEVGAVAEIVTVQGSSPLVNTVSAEQRESMSSLQVMELPISRRNVTNILRLSSGVDAGGGSVRINGQGKSGAGISVDGTDANANPSEGRSMEQYGGRNYFDVMSIEAVQEVQLLRGILAAEYGGVVSGQVNLISKSGTNTWHGSLFENYRSHIFNARNPFQVSRAADGTVLPKNREVFNQFGGSLGGPALRDKAFFFFTYEGYREGTFQRVTGTVPTPGLKQEILRALPFAETKILMDLLAAPTVPIFIRPDVVDPDRGRFEGAGRRASTENHIVARGDYLVTKGSNLTVAYTRNRPFGLNPSFFLNGSNDRFYDYAQDRLSSQYVLTRPHWISETRFGYNTADMERLDNYFTLKDPKNPEKTEWQRRVPRLGIQRIGTWGSAEVWQMEGTTYSLDQKISLHRGKHLIKLGGRYVRYNGSRTNPENPEYLFNDKADMFANIPGRVNISFGSHGPHKSRMYEFGFFAQDDWRISQKLVLNLGLRHDFYSNAVVEATGVVPVALVNLTPPTNLAKFDFGPPRPFDNATEHDGWSNLGPRFGFAFNPDGQGKTVIRGGYGILFAAQVPALLRQSVAHPIVPFRIIWSKAEAQQLGVRYPMYAEETLPIAERDVAASGRRLIFSVLDPKLQNPYSQHFQLNVQRSLMQDLMLEVGYVGVHGVKYPLHRRFNQEDRITGLRPNPLLIPGGYYVDNSENTIYHSLQTSLRKRFSRNLSFDAHYTLGQGLAYAGGDVGVYYGTDANDNIQDFFNYRLDRGPSVADVRHRFIADWIYQLPYLTNRGFAPLRQVLGGWQVSGIISARTGTAVNITQSCAGTYHCRVDYVGGAPVLKTPTEITTGCRPGVHCDILYINTGAFARVPETAGLRIAVRPGNAGKDLVRNPGSWGVELSLAKNFQVYERTKLQFRVDMFNALNHLNWGGVNGSIDSPNFGRITGAGGMRSMQMGLRLNF